MKGGVLSFLLISINKKENNKCCQYKITHQEYASYEIRNISRDTRKMQTFL